jgi:hypothetical protein
MDLNYTALDSIHVSSCGHYYLKPPTCCFCLWLSNEKGIVIYMCVSVRNSMTSNQRITWSSLCADEPRQNFCYLLPYWLHLLGRLLNEHESSCRSVSLVSSQIPHLLVSTKYCLTFCFISVTLLVWRHFVLYIPSKTLTVYMKHGI